MADSNANILAESTVESLRETRERYGVIEPMIRSPLTDFLSVNLHNQHEVQCRNLELHLAECIEAYGFYKGMDKCRAVLHDFQECMFEEKRVARNEIISGEFARQVEAGERNYEKVPFIAFF